jgi:hypothetical protein
LFYPYYILFCFAERPNDNFGLIYRNQLRTEASFFITLPYKDKFVCIYCDLRKNIHPDESDKTDRPREFVLTQATWSADGILLGKKEVAARPEGGLNYFLNDADPLSENTWRLPLGRNRVNMARYYTEIEQWATLAVN